jgi:hypothetical protein
MQTFIGYLGTNMVEFLLEGTNSGGIIDAVVNAGATRIDSIQFEATPSSIIVARRTALTSAIKDALEKAMSIAGTLHSIVSPSYIFTYHCLMHEQIGTLGVTLLIPPRIDLYHVTAPPSTKFSMAGFARNTVPEVIIVILLFIP